ncbi:hypothetical protein X949_5947 [Burkholderia pseudomallei MSHR5609]|nr:hypothetical protein X949_5947 [Burkholderia pseudomallei MSHR5609]
MDDNAKRTDSSPAARLPCRQLWLFPPRRQASSETTTHAALTRHQITRNILFILHSKLYWI